MVKSNENNKNKNMCLKYDCVYLSDYFLGDLQEETDVL